MIDDASIPQGSMILAFLHEPYVSSNCFDEAATITHPWSEQPEWLMILAFVKVHHSSTPEGLCFYHSFWVSDSGIP